MNTDECVTTIKLDYNNPETIPEVNTAIHIITSPSLINGGLGSGIVYNMEGLKDISRAFYPFLIMELFTAGKLSEPLKFALQNGTVYFNLSW
jgi:hypothetical protein